MFFFFLVFRARLIFLVFDIRFLASVFGFRFWFVLVSILDSILFYVFLTFSNPFRKKRRKKDVSPKIQGIRSVR